MYGSCIEDVNHEIYGGLYAQRIFGESFEEPGEIVGPAGWHALGGDWTSTGKELRCPAGSGPILLLQGRQISDGTVEAQLQTGWVQEGSAGLIVRVSNASTGVDSFDGYEIAFQARAGTLTLSRHRHDYQPLAQAPAPIAAGEIHNLRVTLNGPRIRVFLDDEEMARLDFTDRDRPLLSGSFALRSWHADSTFRDVRIAGTPVSLALERGGLSGMWDPIGHPHFAQERNAPDGKLVQKIFNPRAGKWVGIANRGLNRWGIAVRSGQNMDGRITLRGDVGSAVVALQSEDGSRTYARQKISVSAKWQTTAFHLKPVGTDPRARFALLTNGKGALVVSHAVLFDSDCFHGLPIRGDIARKMIAEKLTFLRYGGTMVNVPGYRWKNMIGIPDHRPSYRGNWYPYSTNGFGIFDFLNFCEAAHFRAAFAINIEETPEDVADLADYLTAPVNNPWGARRAADGHPAPYAPEYIEIGNEEGIGDSSHTQLPHYAERFRLLEKAIHARNPKLKLVCAAWWIPGSPDMKTVFDAIDGKATAWDIHVGADQLDSGAQVERELSDIGSSFKKWNPNTGLKAVIFEENGGLHDQQRALGHAAVLNATRRHGDFVLADCPANCLQPWHQNDNGWDQGQIFFTSDKVWGMPPFYAQQLLSQDRQPLRIFCYAPTDLDVVATRSSDGRCVVLTAVNVSSLSREVSVTLKDFRIGSASASSLSGELGSTLPPSVYEKTPASKTGHDQFEITFPPHSVTSLRLLGSPSAWSRKVT
jgi:hypothetical protein